MLDGYMRLHEFEELLHYIDNHHSWRKSMGKRIKYVSPTVDMRIGRIFHIELRRGESKHFSITNENKDKVLKDWIYDWLENGDWNVL